MLRRFALVSSLALAVGQAEAQQQLMPGFPPGVFQSRGALTPSSGGGGFSNTLEYQASVFDLYAANPSFTGVTLGPASSDRILFVMAAGNGAAITGVTICGTTGTALSGNMAPGNPFMGGWYANVTTGTSCTIALTTVTAKDVGISVWNIHGQTGGGSATPSNSSTILIPIVAEPVPLTVTVSAGGTADIMGYCSNAASSGFTWVNASTVGTNILTGAGGATPVLSSAQATVSATVTAATPGADCAYGGGNLGYASWGP